MNQLFVIEGLNYSGKTTAIQLLKTEYFSQDTVYTQEPNGTVIGRDIRKLIFSHAPLSADIALALFTAARIDNISNVINPALKSGKMVIVDRFLWSTIAYQHYGMLLDKQQIENSFKGLPALIEQPYYIFLDCDVDLTLARRLQSNKVEPIVINNRRDFLTNVRRGYLDLVNSHPKCSTKIEVTNLTIAEIAEKISEIIKRQRLNT